MQAARKIIDIGDDMTAEIVEEKDNRVVGRREYVIKVYHVGKGTPSIPDVRVKLAEKLGVEYKRLFIRKLETEYGIGVSNAIVNVYDTVDKALLFEPKYVIERNKTLEEEIEEAEKSG